MATVRNVKQPDNAQSFPTAQFAVNPSLASTRRALTDELGQEGLRAFYGHVTEPYVEQLQWPQAYSIYNEMWRRDPTLRSLILAVRLFARQATWKAEAATDKPADVEAKDFLDENLGDMSHTIADFIDDALSCLPFGWSSFELCYKWRQGAQGTNKSLLSDGRIGWRKFAYRRQSSLLRWELDDSGGFGGWWQSAAPMYKETLLPAEYLMHFTGERDGQNPEGLALFESAYEPWHFVKNLQIINGIGWQRTFVGLPKFTTESKLDPTDQSTVRAVGEGLTVDEKQYVVLPPGVGMELLSTNNSGAASLLDTIKMYRALMLQIILGEFIMQSLLGTGSFAAQSDKSELFIMAVNGCLDKIAETWNRFGVARLFEFEANKFSGMTEHPRVTHTDIRKPNLPGLAEFVSKVAQYIKWGDDDALWLRQQAGLPETLPEEEQARKEPAPGDQPDNQPATDEGDDTEDAPPEPPPANEESQASEQPALWAELKGFDGRDTERSDIEISMEESLTKFFGEQKKRVIEAAQAGRFNGDDELFWEEEEKTLFNMMSPTLTRHINTLLGYTIEDTERIYRISADWGLVNADALAWAREFAGAEARVLTTSTQSAVKQAVVSWIETGGKLDDLSKSLETSFGRNRARANAVNQITKTYVQGNKIAWRASGMAEKDPEKEPIRDSHFGCYCWLAIQPRDGQWVWVWQSRVKNVCVICSPLHNTVVGVARETLGPA